MKRIALAFTLLMAALLAGCGTCIFPTVVGCYVTEDIKVAPEVFRWQKVGQFGNTDPEQRKEDMIECGLPRGHSDNSPSIFGVLPGETVEQMLDRKKKFGQCMKEKGYVQLGLLECGPVKENRGICK